MAVEVGLRRRRLHSRERGGHVDFPLAENLLIAMLVQHRDALLGSGVAVQMAECREQGIGQHEFI